MLVIEFAQDVQKQTKSGEKVFKTLLTQSVNTRKDLSQDLDTLVGTALNELFNLVNVQKNYGVKYFDLSSPISFRIESKGIEVNGSELSTQFQQVLKLNNSAKSKRKFATRLRGAVEQIQRKPTLCKASEIESQLEDQIQAEKIADAMNS